MKKAGGGDEGCGGFGDTLPSERQDFDDEDDLDDKDNSADTSTVGFDVLGFFRISAAVSCFFITTFVSTIFAGCDCSIFSTIFTGCDCSFFYTIFAGGDCSVFSTIFTGGCIVSTIFSDCFREVDGC